MHKLCGVSGIDYFVFQESCTIFNKGKWTVKSYKYAVISMHPLVSQPEIDAFEKRIFIS